MKNFVKSIKDLLFSKKCSICGRVSDEYYICDSCYKELRNKKKLDSCGNYYFTYIYDKEIRTVIVDFKLKNRRGIAKELASLIGEDLKKVIAEKNIDYIIPVPISSSRLSERGFNQVEELLDCLKLEYIRMKRIKNSKHMFKVLTYEERKKNVKNIFQIGKENLHKKNILIVDDIVTSGATMKEISKTIIKLYEPENIYFFSLAMSRAFIKKER